MFGLGFWELAVIFLVAFLVLGPKKLPELAKSIGKGLRDLRRASSDLRSSVEGPLDELRKPLEELRDDLSDTVYSIREQVEREARDLPAVEGSVDGQGALPEGAAPDEIDDRRREVEELYAAAAAEDEAASAHDALLPCDTAGEVCDAAETTPCDGTVAPSDLTVETAAAPPGEDDPGADDRGEPSRGEGERALAAPEGGEARHR